MTDLVAEAQQGAELIAQALRRLGYRADFSPGSAWEIDRFFADQVSDEGIPKPKGILAINSTPRLFALGGYVGELVRRNGDGWEWTPDEEKPQESTRLSLRRGTQIIWPVQRVTKRFIEGPENGIAGYVSALGVDIGAQPEPPRRRWWRLGR